ncbi:Exosome complex component RRP43 [Babesia sp. Xinjiang]|uniref:Exosome complex component RRP43 n=1 Tax=Babesia sp. Xinjiang TaxID=462227 RepID=UPI000A25C788|nr:Exosome complex component RRP43 [Babesia sp. Xinjiang]ORM39983.1 Exosome complex component RRP43 [Babesia sp. Xinjiang]
MDQQEPSTHGSTFPTDVYRSIDPRGFYDKILKQQLRPDGRKLRAFRTVAVSDLLEDYKGAAELSDEDGIVISSVRVTVGDTHVNCAITATPQFVDVEMAESYSPEPLIDVEVELPKQVQSYIYDANGHSANLNFTVATILATVLNSDDILPSEQLIFVENTNETTSECKDDICSYLSWRNFRWKLDINLICEEYDGNLLDLSVMATTYALRKAMLPVILLEYNEAMGVYEMRILDRETLEQTQNPQVSCYINKKHKNTQQANKWIKDNKKAIEKQIETQLMEENMASQLIKHMGNWHYLGRHLKLLAVPFTVTFLRYNQDTFLVDPTAEEERLGTNVSVYCLKRADGSSQTQILNMTCCNGITTEIYQSLRQMAIDIIDCISTNDI